MKHAVYRRSALVVAAVAGAAVLTPLGGVAQAAGGTQAHYYVASKNGAPAALYNYSTGARLSPANATVLDLEASRDGSRLVDLEAAIDNTGQLQTIRVYDAGGNPLNPVASIYSHVGALYAPTLSPDGTVAVWTRSDSTGAKLYAKNLTTGATTLLGSNLYDPTFATPSTLIVRDSNGTKYSLPVTGGTPQAIPSLSPLAIGITVSPDGTKLAWHQHHETSGDGHAPGDIAVAPLFTSGGISVGTPKILATGEDNYAPAFTRNGTYVLFIHADHADVHFAGQVRRVPVDGSSAPVDVGGTVLGAVVTQAVGEIPPVSSLAQPAPLAAVLGGTSATVRWTKPNDADVSQVLVRRYSGSTLQKAKFVPLPTTSWTDTGLVVGRVYKYTFTSVDRAGRQSTAPVPFRNLVAAGAAPSIADPTSRVTTRAPFPVRMGPGAPAIRWTTDYRVNGGSTWTRWVTNTGGMVRTFGAPASVGVAATTSVPGTTYQFRVRGLDSFGNSTATITSYRTVVPLDQSRATLSGGRTVSDTRSWFGSYRRMGAPSNYAKITLTGNRLQVIAFTCSGCGSFQIWDNGKYVGTFSTSASSTLARAVVLTRTYATNATHSFTIKPYSTKPVLLDGIAMRR